MNNESEYKINKNILSQLIFDIKTSGILIKEYTKNDVVRNQIFLIDKITEIFYEYLNIKNNKYKLIKNKYDLIDLIKNIYYEYSLIFKSKKFKIEIDNNIKTLEINLDYKKITTAINSIFLHIYNYNEINGFIKINYEIIDYNDEINIITNQIIKSTKFIQIDISFEGIDLPENIENIMLKKVIINYRKTYTNNIYLYTALSIIKKHRGKFWYKCKENMHNIIILLPYNN